MPGPPIPPTAASVDPIDEPEAYTSGARLEDGDRVRLRPIRPDDKDALQAGLERLSRDSVYTRFFGPKAELTDSELVYLPELDFHAHVALAATLSRASGPNLVGVGRYVLLDDERAPVEGPVAELAITVEDEHQDRGVGGLLFDRLCSMAREQGIEAFVGHVMTSNRAMKRLLESHGDVVDEARDGVGVRMTVRLDACRAGHGSP